jgi:DNA-binding response OmpR family regulator
MRILYVEDDQLFGETITEFLEDEGFSVDHHLDTSTAIDASFDTNYALYLFDLNLPTSSGIEMLKELRFADDMTPTIFLTSSSESEDLKTALIEGADGFITKPVDLDELLLRIKALMRRVYGEETLHYLDFTLDLKQQSIFKNGQRCHMKPKAFALLLLLLQNKNRVVTLQQIEEHLWTQEVSPSTSVIRVYITEIKQIVGSEKVSNIRGVGYQLHD